MQVKFFTIPIKQPDEAAEEANGFLRSHRIMATDRRFVENGENSFWSLAVEYLNGDSPSKDRGKGGNANRIDYKQVLSPEDFEVFSRLREVRKQIATEESVPVYAVFTNEQLAKIVTEKVDGKAAMRKINGVGDATVEKYAERILGEVNRKI